MPPYTTHILVEISSVHNKERLLKTAGEKYQVTYKGKFIRIMADFSAETKKTRKAWNKVLQAMKKKKKNCQPRLLHSAKLSFKIKEETKTF
jgi:hypothetical protein